MKNEYAKVQNEREALHDRTIRSRLPETFATLLFLEQGTVRINKKEEVNGPALCFWPPLHCPVLNLNAGARAKVFGLSDTLMMDCIGTRAESVHLRMLVEQAFVSELTEVSIRPRVHALLDWFCGELSDTEGHSPMSMAAYLRLIFILALRVYETGSTDSGTQQSDILRNFRHLVELRYREHWAISRYADALDISYDRLHRICKRETRRSPAELVHERLTAEAKARLEKSGHPLKKIAADLGFSDSSRFSHFFKRRTNMSPGAYRAVVSRPDGEDLVVLKEGFADWP